MQKLPGMRPFYKYVSPATALKVIETGEFRYSSPLKFNDPFDIQSGLHFDFDISTLHDKVLNRLEVLASAPEEPPVDPEDVWGKIVLESRKYFPKHGFPKARWREASKEPFRLLETVIRQTQMDYKQHWREKMLPGMRIFCVSEDRDNLLMWAHYGQDHKGAVFELWSLPEIDNLLSVAQPVQYVAEPPPFFTEAEWIDDFMGIKKLDSRALYRKYAYAKSEHWEYEKEWRVWYPFSTSEYCDYCPINPKELKAVYIGCQAERDFKDSLLTALKSKFPEAHAFQAHKSDNYYRLEYTDA